MLDRFSMSREEQAILFAAGVGLGLDDVGEPRHGNLHAIDNKCSSARPDFIEVEPSHDEREIDLQAIIADRRGDGAKFHDSSRYDGIARLIERLSAGPQRKILLFAHTPSPLQVL